jgi:hypothetical protein
MGKGVSVEESLQTLKDLQQKGLINDNIYNDVSSAVLKKHIHENDILTDSHEMMESIHAHAKAAMEMPGFKQKPQVHVSYKVESLGDVDCLHPLFNTHFKLFLEWEDMRLIGIKGDQKEILNTDITDTIVPPAHSRFREGWPHWLFNPDLKVINGRDLMCTYYEIKITDPKRGAVKWTKYFNGWLEHDIGVTLKNFPFDFHDLRIELRPHKLALNKCRLIMRTSNCTMETQTEQNEWQVVGHRGQFCSHPPDHLLPAYRFNLTAPPPPPEGEQLETDASSSSTGKGESSKQVLLIYAITNFCIVPFFSGSLFGVSHLYHGCEVPPLVY